MSKIKLNLFIAFLILFPFFIFAQSWEEMQSLANPTGFPVMAVANGKIYLLSGTQGGPAKTFEFNPAANVWTEKTPIPSGTIYASAATVNGKIHVLGGLQNNQKKDLHYIYDPATDAVINGATLLTPRGYHNSVAVDGKVYLIGGQNGDGTTEWYFDEYNPDKDQWTRKEQTPHNQAWYCGAVELQGKFYRIAGGRWNVPTDYFDEYNPETNSWTSLDPFPITCHAPAAVTLENKIFVMGGYNSEHKIDSIYTYYPSTKMWILSFVKLPEPMAYHKAVALDGNIYIYNKDEATSNGRLWRYKFGSVGVKENSVNSFKCEISPNPCNNLLKISFEGENACLDKIEIYDVIGNCVFRSESIGDDIASIQIDASFLNSGTYFIRLYHESGVRVEKFIME